MTLQELHEAARTAQEHAERCAAAFHRAIADALDSGQSATQIARDLDVSRGRVYQWRGKAK